MPSNVQRPLRHSVNNESSANSTNFKNISIKYSLKSAPFAYLISDEKSNIYFRSFSKNLFNLENLA